MMKNLLRVGVVAVLVVVLISIVACGSETSKSTDSKNVKPQYGGILKIGNDSDGGPCLGAPTRKLGAFPEAAVSNLFGCLEGLTWIDKSGKMIPHLATSWTINAAARSITFKLRKGVKFHDGSDFNAEVVRWNLSKTLPNAQQYKNVASIDVVDDYTVRIVLTKWDSSFPFRLWQTFLISKATYYAHGGDAPGEGGETAGNNWCYSHPVGTGPFKFVSWEPNVKTVYTRFDGYWGPKPYLDGYEWIQIADNTVRAMALQSGEIDVVRNLAPKDASHLVKLKKWNVTNGVPTGCWLMLPDTAHADSVMADRRVREAVEYAIDKETLCKTLGYGYWTPLYQITYPGDWEYNPKAIHRRYDPDKARKLLAEAGYSASKPLKVTISYPFMAPLNIIPTALQSYLTKVGIKCDIKGYNYTEFTMGITVGGWKNGLITSGDMAPFELGNTIGLANFMFNSVPSIVKSIAPWPEIGAIAAQAAEAGDFATQQALIHELIKRMQDNSVAIYLFASNGVSARSPKVHDDGMFQMLYMPYGWTPGLAWKEK